MIIIKYFNLYVPLNQNINSFRHYGIKYDKLLFFELHELFHIISSEKKKDYPPYIKAYFDMKIRHNLLRDNPDMSTILEFNTHLYNEMLSTNMYYIDKFIIKNESVVEWQEIKKEASLKLSNKELNLFKPISDKLKKHESYFKKICDSVYIPRKAPIMNFSTTNFEFSSDSLFKICESFDNFFISLPTIDNNSIYLKSTQNKTTFDLLERFNFSVYNCDSNFNRLKTRPLTEMIFFNKYVKVQELLPFLKNKVVCVISNDEYAILKFDTVILDMSNPENQLKKRKME